MTREFIVSVSDAGSRLDRFLAAHSELSRARIQKLIEAGHAQLNAGPAKTSERLRLDDRVTLAIPPVETTDTLPQSIPLEVLFEDEDLIVINKPAGMVVHPAAGNREGTVVNALLHHCSTLSGIGGEKRPGIVHRLDKETSGCLVAAKNDAAHHNLAHQFASREVTKIYLALVAGHPAALFGKIAAPIGRHPVHRKQMTVVKSGRGREARTTWRVLQLVGEGALVECTLHTGRTHQIRVHLKHLGHPLLGDAVYGKRAGFSRQMLHAWRLGFAHPRVGSSLSFESPIPSDFVEAGVPAALQ